jgi:hypothetical protein
MYCCDRGLWQIWCWGLPWQALKRNPNQTSFDSVKQLDLPLKEKDTIGKSIAAQET